MIIGKGLIAKSLKEVDTEDCVFFCSGVSNSNEKSIAAFTRELELLKMQDKTKLLVYFSTISIFNPSKSNNDYIKHKINLENYIESNFDAYLVLRLPNMIGDIGNRANLFPFLLDKIRQSETVVIHKNARRHLLSANQLSKIITLLFRQNARGFINVCFSNPPLVVEIYEYLCELLNKHPMAHEGSEEPEFKVDNDLFLSYLNMYPSLVSDNWKTEIQYVLLTSGPGQLGL